MKNNITLAMITKGEAGLSSALESAAPYVTEIVLVCDPADEAAVRKIAESGYLPARVLLNHTVTVLPVPWPKNFAKAREASFEAASNDYIMWLDSDDTLVVEDPKAFAAFLDSLDGPMQVMMPYHTCSGS